MSSLDWKEIEINWRGKRVKGRYIVSDDLVTVAALEWHQNSAAGHIACRALGGNVAPRTSI